MSDHRMTDEWWYGFFIGCWVTLLLASVAFLLLIAVVVA